MPLHRRIHLAVNYSQMAATLVETGAMEVDFFKCPNRTRVLEKARRQRPVYVHFPLYSGRCMGEVADLDAVAERLQKTGTPYVTTRLDPQIEPQTGMMGGLFSAIDRTLRNVRTLAAHFGTDRVIVENAPYYKEQARHGSMAAEPAFIRQVVEETGCGFLLNLAHASVAARSMEMDARLYLSLLPVEALRALHVAGTPTQAGPLREPVPMTDPDWALFDWVVERIGEDAWGTPRIMALEYGGVGPWFEARTDPAVLARQLSCLQQTVRELAATATAPLRRNGFVQALS